MGNDGMGSDEYDLMLAMMGRYRLQKAIVGLSVHDDLKVESITERETLAGREHVNAPLAEPMKANHLSILVACCINSSSELIITEEPRTTIVLNLLRERQTKPR